MKQYLTSKTLWANTIAIGAIIVQSQTGFLIDPATQVVLLGAINAIIRTVTKEPLAWKKTDA